MSDAEYSTESYCALCDMYFPSIKDRAEHVADALNHPRCHQCVRRFLNGNALRNHFTYSRYHHYCALCDVSFETAAGLRMHIEHSAVHTDDSDDEDDGESSTPILVEGQEDYLGALTYPDEDSDDGGEYSDDDDSWENFDECDFEDEEELGDVTYDDVRIREEEGEEEENVDGIPADKFTCPICQLSPNTVCSTSCGHLFCAQCIRLAYDIQNSCPVCDEAGSVEQLRKLYISV
ncbi:hypothetical protein H0H81_004810 [Sphagnurus paluster]|uniref:RING-type domain-containing protein n=1 Tax=Sphagnurus paluster TaxID=117069 RepID=A0A9P7KJC7_9AGAR|nr:hypothetical protein H0H81_004810 [Sphagnurus paluster]